MAQQSKKELVLKQFMDEKESEIAEISDYLGSLFVTHYEILIKAFLKGLFDQAWEKTKGTRNA